MIRETLASGSSNAFMAVTPANGYTFQSRSVPAGVTTSIKTPGAAPRWVKLERRGQAINAYHSADGIAWILQGSVTIPMNASVYAGLAVTSHNNSQLTSADFEQVALQNGLGSARIYGYATLQGGTALSGSYVECQEQGQAGTYRCLAFAPDYGITPQVTVTLPPPARADFLFTRPEATLDWASFQDTLNVGQTRAFPLRLTNTGNAPLEFDIVVPSAKYVWSSSDSPEGPAFAWSDIKTTGARLSLASGTSGAVAQATLSFPFPFYDSMYNVITVTEHGYLSVSDHDPFPANLKLPSDTNAARTMIAGFWDEIGLHGTGAVYFQDYGDRAVFQYQSVARQFAGTGTYTFQIVLYRNGVIRFYYLSMDGPGAGATEGLQEGKRGVSIKYGEPFIHSRQAVELRRLAREWVSFSPASGLVPPGGSRAVSVLLDAGALSPGVYSERITLFHNAPHQGSLPLTAYLMVQGAIGGVRQEVWADVPGILLTDLYTLPAYPKSPNLSELLPRFEGPRNAADNYGERLRAYVMPPVTGDYTFFISGDDQCELRLGSDDHPGRAVAIARVSGYTPYRNWTKYPDQKSAALRLVAGKRYFLEAVHKEGTGGDHASVGWQGPGIGGEADRPIPGSRLTPYEANGWKYQDIGSPSLPGSRSIIAENYQIKGGGSDIWDAADQSQFVYRPMTGDGEIIAQVTSIENTHVWAKAGVMMRETLDTGSRHVFSAVSAASGQAFLRRLTTGGTSFSTRLGGAATSWVRLVRSGNTFSSYFSTDGATWVSGGSENIAMTAAVWVGLAVTSHNEALLTTGFFRNVSAP